MDDNQIKSYRKAGKIASRIREWSRSLIQPGMKIIEIAEKIEEKIISLGGEIAFPVNICINNITAHYTPKFNDKITLERDDVVSIDMGVHINGYIADTAYTIDLSGEYERMLKANEEALKNAIDIIKPGVKVSEIGSIIQKTIHEYGFKPIENLTGHEIKQYDLHAGISIPNIEVPYKWEIEEGMVLALEPFATNGYGRVIESKRAEIFSLLENKPTRLREARLLLNEIEGRKKLPFAKRWFCKKINPMKLSLILRDLVSNEILKEYPILHEKENGIVSQFEHTVMVVEDGCEVITH